MHFPTLTILLLLVPVTYAAYNLVDNYLPGDFATKFNFFTDDDPTHGYVNYVDQSTAESSQLFKVQNGKLYMGVDYTNIASGRGRNAVRIFTKAKYTRGLFILDLDHMPDNQCGSWPAFWAHGPHWPNNGEIDIIEGVNTQVGNLMTLHTGPNCSIINTHDFTGHIVWRDCYVNATVQPADSGCNIKSDLAQTFGTGLNAVGGGVYAMEWTNEAIRVWFFSRSSIPSDIASGNPDPNSWDLPLSKFSGCDFESHFHNHSIIFNVAFCGDWAGSYWSSNGACIDKASSCEDYVKNNPADFKNVYWLINSLKIYQVSSKSSMEKGL
ncbi:hypothetical protein FO519_006751 [Halicephalobus sp. NKZ332]|nr:hypothetical protein FO519_006751 [Halicephalobus sp. NKZ332]